MPNMSNYDRVVWEEGEVEGLAKGLAEGRTEGRVSGLQEALMELATHRFGPSGILLRDRIEAVHDEVELRTLTRSILSASGLEDFAQQLPRQQPS